MRNVRNTCSDNESEIILDNTRCAVFVFSEYLNRVRAVAELVYAGKLHTFVVCTVTRSIVDHGEFIRESERFVQIGSRNYGVLDFFFYAVNNVNNFLKLVDCSGIYSPTEKVNLIADSYGYRTVACFVVSYHFSRGIVIHT